MEDCHVETVTRQMQTVVHISSVGKIAFSPNHETEQMGHNLIFKEDANSVVDMFNAKRVR